MYTDEPVGPQANGTAMPARPAGQPQWWQARWVLPTGVGFLALLVGVAIGGAGDSAGESAAGSGSDPTVTVTADPEPAETVTLDPTEQQLADIATREAAVAAKETEVAAREAAVAATELQIAAGTIPGSGKFLVGTDIQPGTYRGNPQNESCYWERLSGVGGTFDEIITNENADGPTVVEIRSSDAAFSSEDCGEWVLIP